MNNPSGEIIFLGIPTHIAWEATPLLKALYLAGIQKITFTPVEENEKGIEEIITRASSRASVVCLIGTRVSGWQQREELIRKLLYRVSRKRLMLKDGELLPSGIVSLSDPNDIPLFILPFEAHKKEDFGSKFSGHTESALLIMTPGTRETVCAFQDHIKEAIKLLPVTSGGGTDGQWIRMFGERRDEITQFIHKNPHCKAIQTKIVQRIYGLDLLVASEKSASLLEATSAIRKKFGEFCYSFNGETIEEVIGAALLSRGETLAIAESCTGGAISARITKIAGASRYFTGAAVPYSNPSKEEQLSIPHALLHEEGAVSPEVASEMASAVRALESSDWGLSVTGIAGPSGGSPEKPVGLVYIGISNHEETLTTEHHLYGSRDEIREQTVEIALETIWRHLQGHPANDLGHL
ncbi:MAG: nicotinamide-nucleotide amidohydrolase family protein [Nitrospirota bacterium]